ncbi:MAG: S24/S26 family peptidase [Clostridia bacterium]|nr:S24/S26 family peptidase [Clostridia bacterium]
MDKVELKNAREALSESAQIEVLTQGNSMAPLFKEHRDIAVIKRPENPLKKGDIVLYTRNDESFVLHRIVRIKGEELVIRGDNNLNLERDIKADNIIGVLTALYRNGKYMQADSFIFKLFGILSTLRFPFIYVYRKVKQFLWKKLKAER